MVLPAILRLRLAINEIISTLLLNYVALNFLFHLLYGAWSDPKSGFPNSEQYQAAERLPLIGWQNLGWSVPLALRLALLCWWLMNVSRFGFFMKFVGANPTMARAVGIPVGAVTLGAALHLRRARRHRRLCDQRRHRMPDDAVLLPRLRVLRHPDRLPRTQQPARRDPRRLLRGVLFVAGQSLQVFYQIPAAMVQLIQAIIVIAVAGSDSSSATAFTGSRRS